MADVDASGSLISTNYAVIPLLNTAETEGGEEEIFTDQNFVGSQQVAGTFASQMGRRFVLAKAGVTSENDITYAFIRSAGLIKAALPVGETNGGAKNLPASIPYPVTLLAGDQVIAMVNTASDREVGLSVACSNGEYHIFSVTPSGAGEQELTSIITGLSLGSTLQGRIITHMFCMGGNNTANFSSPVYILDGSGVPIGAVNPVDPLTNSGTFEYPCRVAVALNSRAVFRTDA